ncbi:MAG: GNAT family N-acetyltransferase [Dehalobacter sp.]|nr:GNAT family N-acetyltransferase [Dehalobacter sp.]
MILACELKYKELKNGESSSNKELKKIVRSGAVPYGKRYFIIYKNKEVAFLYLDYPPFHDYVILYEIYVITEHRNKGIAKLILDKTDELCKLENRQKIKLYVHSLDKLTNDEQLVKLYESKSYKISSTENGRITMEKVLIN